MKTIPLIRSLFAAAFAVLVAGKVAAADSPRERLLLDFNWKFHLGNDWGTALDLAKAASSSGPASQRFNDAGWRTVNLPHDWAVELPFDKNSDMSHGYKPVGPGFAANDVGWYRRTFDLPKEDAGKRLWLEFDGVYRDCTVFVNGWLVGHHEGGYNGFRYDITDVANVGGRNTIAVRVDASQFEGWFYEGAGIYRHTWLVKTAPVAIAPDGIFVWSKFENNMPKGNPEVGVEVRLLNTQTNAVKATVKCEIIHPSGKFVLEEFSETEKLERESQRTVKLESKLYSPLLWSPENPKLYKLITTVSVGGKVVDRKETEFGIRTLAFDATNGFLLNGKHYPIQGTCNHQDMAGVGTALPDALQYFRIAKLKEMGCNAYRTSHNPPTPELLEACDRLGMLVLDENRIVGGDAENLQKLEEQIRRDRNHPGVFAWSLGNEEWGSQGTASGAASIRTMQNLAHSLDPTRECTAALNGSYGNTGFITVLDVKGFNYNLGSIDPYRKKHPDATFIGTETASTVTTRGIYTNDLAKGYVAAYDVITKTRSGALVNPVTWGETAEQWWSFYDARPWMSGGFAWTGFDYRGEPTPYAWPCINSHFGIMDMCGFPKDNFYYYQSWWTTNTVLHLLPHWNWPGKEGQEIRVDALSNCKQVELFLNGTSLGKQAMKPNSKLSWQVKYAPGTLSAKGFDDAGNVIAETKVETTGDATQIQLTPGRKTINADGEDVGVFTVSAVDAQGRVVPVAQNKIYFAIEGAGEILGVGNGDPSCHEPDVFIPQSPVRNVAVNNWRWQRTQLPSGRGALAPEYAPDFDDSSWNTIKPKTDDDTGDMPLKENETAIYRAHITLTEDDVSSPNVQIRFGTINGHGYIFVNNQRVGESHDYLARPAFDIKRVLHVGDNVIAVGVKNDGGAGGLSPEVNVEIIGQPVEQPWSRSLFNGLAQIIVQSNKDSGEIKLTASSEGLQPMTTVVQTQPCTPTPSVP